MNDEASSTSASLVEMGVSTAVIVALYLLGNLASVYIFHPIQAMFFPELTELVSLLFCLMA